MRTGLTKKQKVTEVYYNAKDPTAEVYTHDTKLKKRLLEYATKFPELCQQTDDDEQGGLRFEIDKSRISIRLTAPYSEERRNAANDYDRLQQRFSRECAKTARMGDRIDELADDNKILRGIAADFDRAKKALGKDKVEAAVESAKQEEARVQVEKHRKTPPRPWEIS